MNLSKELKKKRDAEDRLRNSSPQVVFVDSGTIQTFDNYATKADLAGKADVDHSHEITELTDVSITYTDNAGKFLKVNSTEDGIDLGEVSGGASAFTDLTDAPSAYTDMAGKVVKVNSTEDGLEFGDGGGSIEQATETTLGGIKAAAKTTETAEVKIDTATGKLYVPASGGSGGTDAESILTKPITIPSFVGKDGYILAYNETNGEFYLKKDDGGGGGGFERYYIEDLSKSTIASA